MVGMLGDQQRLGLFPGPAAILLDVPVMRADIVEEPFALVLVRDQPAERQVRDRSGSAPCRCRRRCGGFRSCCPLQCGRGFLVAPGMAASIAFFMTVGRASPAMSSARRPAMAGRRGRRLTSARKTSSSSAKWVKTCAMLPARRQSAGEGRGVRRRRAVDARGPAGGRHLGHAAEQALVRALAQQDGAVAAGPRRRPHRAATACPPWAARTGKRSGSPATIARQSSRSGQSMQRGRLRRADRGAEIHHRLGEVAGPCLRHQRLDTARGSRPWPRAAASRSQTAAR